MAQDGETKIEMVRRHIRTGEDLIARQRAILSRFEPSSPLAETARNLLTLFEETLEHHRQHLARLLR